MLHVSASLVSPAQIYLHLLAVLNYLLAALTPQPEEAKTEVEQVRWRWRRQVSGRRWSR